MNFMRLFNNLERVEQFRTRCQKNMQMMKMNWNVMVSSRNRKHVSRSMMIKAKNIIMKERICITGKLTLGGLIPAYCAGRLEESLLVSTKQGDQAPT